MKTVLYSELGEQVPGWRHFFHEFETLDSSLTGENPRNSFFLTVALLHPWIFFFCTRSQSVANIPKTMAWLEALKCFVYRFFDLFRCLFPHTVKEKFNWGKTFGPTKYWGDVGEMVDCRRKSGPNCLWTEFFIICWKSCKMPWAPQITYIPIFWAEVSVLNLDTLGNRIAHLVRVQSLADGVLVVLSSVGDIFWVLPTIFR